MSLRGVTGVGTTYDAQEGLGAESSGVFLSSSVPVFVGGLGDE